MITIVTVSCYAQAYKEEIEQRQNTFAAIEDNSDFVEEELDEDQPNWQEIEQRSLKLVEHTKSLKLLFSPESAEDSRARTAIWEDPQKFNRLMTQLNSGFEELYQASKNQNMAAAEDALETAQDTCNSCHMSYRSLW